MTLSASMRPPDLPGGNEGTAEVDPGSGDPASMRPPDLPGGNAKVDAAAYHTQSALQ